MQGEYRRMRAILEKRVEGKSGTDWLFQARTKSGHVVTVDDWHQNAIEKAKIADPFVIYSLMLLPVLKGTKIAGLGGCRSFDWADVS